MQEKKSRGSDWEKNVEQYKKMVEEVKEEKAMPCAQKRKERENCRLNVIKSRKLMSYSREYRLSATTLEVVVSYFQARI